MTRTPSPRAAPHVARLLTIVMPVFNEERTIASIIARVRAVALPAGMAREIIAVDDASRDRTAAILAELAQRLPELRVISHARNQGKGAALRTGFAAARGDLLLVQDADLEYDPADIYGVIRPILEGHADVVFGSRFLVRRAARVLYFYHFLANKCLTFLSNALTNLNMTDVETGYKAFRGDIIRSMIIVSSGFGFEVEVTAKIAKLKVAIYEVPISYYGRTYAEGKKVLLKDGLIALWFVIRFNLFCRLRSSFRELPELQPRLNRGTAPHVKAPELAE